MRRMNTKNQGFTLVEYMVGITVGLILLAGISSFFIGMKQSTVAQNGISEIQENGRFALHFFN